MKLHRASAECLTCGKHWDTINAQATAVKHSKDYGHEITVEIILQGRYENGLRTDTADGNTLSSATE